MATPPVILTAGPTSDLANHPDLAARVDRAIDRLLTHPNPDARRPGEGLRNLRLRGKIRRGGPRPGDPKRPADTLPDGTVTLPTNPATVAPVDTPDPDNWMIIRECDPPLPGGEPTPGPEDMGDFALAIVLWHEWRHVVQSSLPFGLPLEVIIGRGQRRHANMFAQDIVNIDEAIQILWAEMASSEDPNEELEEIEGLQELKDMTEDLQKGANDAAIRLGH
jgi:hypothetical protein